MCETVISLYPDIVSHQEWLHSEPGVTPQAETPGQWPLGPVVCGDLAANEELGGKNLAEVRDVDKLSSLRSKF